MRILRYDPVSGLFVFLLTAAVPEINVCACACFADIFCRIDILSIVWHYAVLYISVFCDRAR